METRGKKAAGPGCGASPGGKNPVPGGGCRVDGRPTATKHRRQRAGQRVGKMGLNSWPVQRRSRTKTSSPVSATARLLLEHPCRCGLPQVGCAGSAARRDEEIPRAESTRNGAAMRRSICGTPELGCGPPRARRGTDPPQPPPAPQPAHRFSLRSPQDGSIFCLGSPRRPTSTSLARFPRRPEHGTARARLLARAPSSKSRRAFVGKTSDATLLSSRGG